MSGECFNCGRVAVERYTMTLDDPTTLSGVSICDDCLAAFRAEEWIEVDEPAAVKE